ncbi:hypothetical protein HK100_002283 [Physocladia obscura]|uniref:Glycosyl transferase family 1 domain-containing protein n=1 Tax=Physocladia obscura TaxID=109957 RepID=A0AAD5SWL1_9FUNG|nr:hypothetical protein HK100_002283 [Physocladia obscura]
MFGFSFLLRLEVTPRNKRVTPDYSNMQIPDDKPAIPEPGPPREFPYATVDAIIRPNDAIAGFTMQEIVDLCHYGGNLHLSRFQAFKSDNFSASAQDYIDNCYLFEFSTSTGGRSMGHCSDFANYIYYGGARLSLDFGVDPEIYKRKVRNCPNTVHIHGEYPNWQLFGPNITNYWMPNLEQIKNEQMSYFAHFDTILCKVKAMCTAMEALIEAQKVNNTLGIEMFPKLKYMSHSTPDPVEDGPKLLGKEKFNNITQDFNSFYHSFGHSGRKSTWAVFDCWSKHPEWPTLTIVGNQRAIDFVKQKERYGPLPRNYEFPKNIRVKSHLEFPELRQLQLAHGVHLCPSTQEGFGHYINEARAVGAVVVTTNHAPMNEFIQDGVSGFLVGHREPSTEPYQGMAPYFKSVATVDTEHVCLVVSKVLKLTIDERKLIGQNARYAYIQDKNFMINNIEELRKQIENIQ